VLNCKFTA